MEHHLGLYAVGGQGGAGPGLVPAADSFWSAPFQRGALDSGILADVTSIMDIGLLLGGLAMGYGARLSYGCNIGAFFSGVASTSLHGWLWIIAALPGAWVGVRLRPLFGLAN